MNDDSATEARLLQQVEAILRESAIAAAPVAAAEILRAALRASTEGKDVSTQAVEMARRFAGGVPLAYVVGRTGFMGIELLAEEGALVPREETELLARTAIGVLASAPQADKKLRMIDMCCGSGNVACGVAAHVPGLEVWASDLTDGAVSLARRNAHHTGLAERVKIFQGDLFGAFSGLGLEEKIDVVTCNPPYISSGKLAKASADLLVHEPREAFDGGPFGVSIFQRTIRDAASFLRAGGTLLFEVGLGQDRQVSTLFERSARYESIEVIYNAANEPRVVTGRKKSS